MAAHGPRGSTRFREIPRRLIKNRPFRCNLTGVLRFRVRVNEQPRLQREIARVSWNRQKQRRCRAYRAEIADGNQREKNAARLDYGSVAGPLSSPRIAGNPLSRKYETHRLAILREGDVF